MDGFLYDCGNGEMLRVFNEDLTFDIGLHTYMC